MVHMAQTNPSTLTADANSTEAFEKAARLGTGEEISIQAPFSGKRKSDVIREGVKLGVPFE